MSYCRFSTDAFRCDVYAYESCNGGWVIHVARRKRDVPADWRDPLEMLVEPGKTPEECAAAYKQFHEDYEKLPWRDLTGPSAGETFTEYSLEDFRSRMQALRNEGVRFPDYVFSAIDDEIAEQTVN